MTHQATVVFTTHNRQDTLRQAIHAALKQTITTRIIVMDDASTDGTAEMMAKEFSSIEYHRSAQNLGPCYHRNRGIELADTEVVFPLDDDSILQSPYTIEQTLQEFDHQTGAVAIPFCNVLQDQIIHTKAPDTREVYLTHAFVAASHAVHRNRFLSTGGYREFFFYMGEEGDVCIRLLQKRFFVRLGNADPIHHLQPPNRISARADIFGRQNDILFVHCNTPPKILVPHLLGTSVKGLVYGWRVKRLGNMLKGFYQGYSMILSKKVKPETVNSDCFHLYRLLKQKSVVPFSTVKSYFEVSP